MAEVYLQEAELLSWIIPTQDFEKAGQLLVSPEVVFWMSRNGVWGNVVSHPKNGWEGELQKPNVKQR